jgi:hypothetical protein
MLLLIVSHCRVESVQHHDSAGVKHAQTGASIQSTESLPKKGTVIASETKHFTYAQSLGQTEGDEKLVNTYFSNSKQRVEHCSTSYKSKEKSQLSEGMVRSSLLGERREGEKDF